MDAKTIKNKSIIFSPRSEAVFYQYVMCHTIIMDCSGTSSGVPGKNVVAHIVHTVSLRAKSIQINGPATVSYKYASTPTF